MTTCLRIASLFILLTASLAVHAELDHLKRYIRTTYPVDSRTIIDAAEYLLSATDYKVILSGNAPKSASDIATKPIPPLARSTRTMTVEQALASLVGPNNYLVVDREHKLVSFTKEP